MLRRVRRSGTAPAITDHPPPLGKMDADTATDFVALLIGCAFPDLTPAVIANWAAAIHFARAHHIRPFKVRAFLYVKGGINACATLYRAGGGARTERSLSEDGKYRLTRRRGTRKPVRKALPVGGYYRTCLDGPSISAAGIDRRNRVFAAAAEIRNGAGI